MIPNVERAQRVVVVDDKFVELENEIGRVEGWRKV